MPENQTIKDLKNIVDECNLIASKHDGIHNLQGSAAGLRCWLSNAEDFGIECVNWENVDYLIKQMRIADKTGFWPKE